MLVLSSVCTMHSSNIHHYVILRSLSGPRVCIGEPLARMELFLIFANLVQSFRFSTVPGEDYNLDGVQALTLTALPYNLSALLR